MEPAKNPASGLQGIRNRLRRRVIRAAPHPFVRDPLFRRCAQSEVDPRGRAPAQCRVLGGEPPDHQAGGGNRRAAVRPAPDRAGADAGWRSARAPHHHGAAGSGAHRRRHRRPAGLSAPATSRSRWWKASPPRSCRTWSISCANARRASPSPSPSWARSTFRMRLPAARPMSGWRSRSGNRPSCSRSSSRNSGSARW